MSDPRRHHATYLPLHLDPTRRQRLRRERAKPLYHAEIAGRSALGLSAPKVPVTPSDEMTPRVMRH